MSWTWGSHREGHHVQVAEPWWTQLPLASSKLPCAAELGLATLPSWSILASQGPEAL